MTGRNVWCVHYQGVNMHGTCAAGIAFADIHVKGAGFPCFKDRDHLPCAKRRFPTQAEQEEQERQMEESLRRFQHNLDNDICPHCETAITRYRQVGRCVYADPCGHRLYQGTIPRKERT